MADNLVQELREEAECYKGKTQACLTKAADRIERLETALRIVMELSHKRSHHPMSPEADYFCIAGAALEGQDGEKV